MLISIEKVLPAPALADLRAALSSADAPWVDGRITAGYQGAAVKFNQQIDDASALASQWRRVVVAALERHPGFISATLPNALYPPMFNRYGEGMTFGPHVDGSIRIDPVSGRKLRTDVSATLFLSDPQDYDGGELRIHDQYGAHAVKGAAGDLVVYPATSLHQVAPITRGVRLACVFWVQSLVRDDAQRALLFDMDTAIQRLNQQAADEPARQLLVGCYHNLLRQWADT